MWRKKVISHLYFYYLTTPQDGVKEGKRCGIDITSDWLTVWVWKFIHPSSPSLRVDLYELFLVLVVLTGHQRLQDQILYFGTQYIFIFIWDDRDINRYFGLQKSVVSLSPSPGTTLGNPLHFFLKGFRCRVF